MVLPSSHAAPGTMRSGTSLGKAPEGWEGDWTNGEDRLPRRGEQAMGCLQVTPLNLSPHAPWPPTKTAPGTPTAGTSPRTSAKSLASTATSAPPTPTPPTEKSRQTAMSPSLSNGPASTTTPNSVSSTTTTVTTTRLMADGIGREPLNEHEEWNVYIYVQNKTINNFDVAGLFIDTVWDVGEIVVGAVTGNKK